MTQPAKILIVKLSSLGDLFHVLPAVHRIKTGLGAEIHWVVQAEYAGVVKCFDDVDRVISFHRKAVLGHMAELYRDIRAELYDCVVDMQGLLKSALISRLARARRYIGPSYHREGTRLLYREIAGPANVQRHAVDQALDVTACLGLASGDVRFPVTFPAANLADPGPRIAIVPRSRWATKNWPRDRFLDVARTLQKQCGGTVFLLGGHGDRELTDWMAPQLPGPVKNLAGRISLVETGGILKEMDVLVANDSGPVHMAVALGVPTVVVFGATDARRTGPYGPGHAVLGSDISCRPCLSRTCQRVDLKCLTDVPVSDVVAKARAVLEARRVIT